MASPSEATFSYQAPSDPSIWGPFCCDCMNRWYSSGQFGPSTPLYLHLQKCAVLCNLEGLFAKNGMKEPFTFGCLEDELRKNDCTYERCRRNQNGEMAIGEGSPTLGKLDETSFFSITKKEAWSQTIGFLEENERHEEDGIYEAAQAVEQTPSEQICLLEEQMAFKRLAANVYEVEAKEAELEVGEIAEEESELEFSSPVASTGADEQTRDTTSKYEFAEKCCSLSPGGFTLGHMHLSSDGWLFLTDDELVSVSKEAYKLMEKNSKCFESGYQLIRTICVPTCYVCGFRAACCCEYALHVFGPLHCGVLVKNKIPVSRKSFEFWLEQMFQLRRQSRFYIPHLQLNPAGFASLTVKTEEALFADLQPDVFSELPMSCKLEEEVSALTFMNAHTTSKDELLEETYLDKLAEAIRIHYSSECYLPVSGCPYIRHYCPQTCPLCGFFSKCACRYVFHLFGQQHVTALVKNKIKVSQRDIRFWLNHLVAFSQKTVNCQMRPILKPLVSLVPDVTSFDYPLHIVTEKTPSWTTSKFLINWKGVFR